MSKNKLVIVDLGHAVGATLPVSDRTFYQCINCWSILSSNPSDNEYCVCGNSLLMLMPEGLGLGMNSCFEFCRLLMLADSNARSRNGTASYAEEYDRTKLNT